MAQQKYRNEFKTYLVEGDKLAREWLHTDTVIEYIAGEEEWIRENDALIRRHPEAEVVVMTASRMLEISSLKTPNRVVLVAEQRKDRSALPVREWVLVLDSVRDPGNLGTIIRIADWFGVAHVVCSPDCADAFNPKVVQAAMGGHLRVHIHYTLLEEYLPVLEVPVLAATLSGKNIYELPPFPAAALMIGNESRGLRPELIRLAGQEIMIPRMGGAESLNAAVSAGIFCGLLMRPAG